MTSATIRGLHEHHIIVPGKLATPCFSKFSAYLYWFFLLFKKILSTSSLIPNFSSIIDSFYPGGNSTTRTHCLQRCATGYVFAAYMSTGGCSPSSLYSSSKPLMRCRAASSRCDTKTNNNNKNKEKNSAGFADTMLHAADILQPGLSYLVLPGICNYESMLLMMVPLCSLLGILTLSDDESLVYSSLLHAKLLQAVRSHGFRTYCLGIKLVLC